MSRTAAICLAALSLLSQAVPVVARTVAADAREEAAAAAMDRIKGDEASLRVFLQAMPKGGNLHLHSWGTAMAEDYIGWAVEDGLCVARVTLAFAPPPCDKTARPGVASLSKDPALRTALIDALSAPADVTTDLPRHDKFFDTFSRISALFDKSTPRELALVRREAARDHVLYVEFMANPAQIWDMGKVAAALPAGLTLDQMLARLKPEIASRIAPAKKDIGLAEQAAAGMLRCASADADPGCAVEVRYLATIGRTASPADIFGQMTMAFALADADPRVVGVNILEPEDDPVAIADYHRHMEMFAYLSKLYPRVKLSLHAGELTNMVAPPAALDFHIGEAVRIAGASRIGHGVSIAQERDAAALLTEMANRHIAVEINLSSNDVILGVRGAAHPLHLYLSAKVPVVLATDDPGVLRIDLTHEYVRAAAEQHLDYRDLKRISRNALEYSFLPGESLWKDRLYGTSACAGTEAADMPKGACAALLAGSVKAKVQWKLEQSFARFESHLPIFPSTH